MKARRSLVLGIIAILLTTSIAGCLKPDPNMVSPISAYPKITVDFVDNVTKIYVQALSDVRYSNMTLHIYHGNVTYIMLAENNTYSLHVSVSERLFTLKVTATDTTTSKTKKYSFEGDISVRPASDPSVLLRISLDNQGGTSRVYKLQSSDLPWSRIGDRIK